MDEIADAERAKKVSNVEVGLVTEGVVESLKPYGAFIDLGGVDGLVHVSQISNKYLENPATALQVGQEVEAKVVDFNEEDKKISLSIKALAPAAEPVEEVVEETVEAAE